MLPAPLPPHPNPRPPPHPSGLGEGSSWCELCAASLARPAVGSFRSPSPNPSSGLPTHQARCGEGPAWGVQEGPLPRPWAPCCNSLGLAGALGFSGPLLPPPPSASMFPKAPSCLPRLSLCLGAGVGEAEGTAHFTAEGTEAQRSSTIDLRWWAVAGPAPFSLPHSVPTSVAPICPLGPEGQVPSGGGSWGLTEGLCE